MKTTLAIFLAIALTGCATARKPVTVSTAVVATHAAQVVQHTAAATQAVQQSSTHAAQTQTAIHAAQQDAVALQDHKDDANAIESLQAHLTLALTQNEGTQAANDVTKAELVKVTLASEQLEIARADLQKQTDALVKQEEQAVKEKQAAVTIADAKTKEAHQNAKERDVVIIAFAVMFALWIASKTGTLVSQAFPQYAILAQAGLFALSLAAGYALGRTVLFFFAKFIP